MLVVKRLLNNKTSMFSFVSNNPLWLLILFSFLLFSWPFFEFPITDGDVANWSKKAAQFATHLNFFQTPNDQAHGPLLIWTGAIFLK